MLFNSYIFIFFFLPITLVSYFGLNHVHKYNMAKCILVIASLIFYGYNEPSYVLIILSSVVLNYFCFLSMNKFPKIKNYILFIGIVANISVLGYFKYVDFLLVNINALMGSSFSYLNIALPLGISFFTFQQISFLVDSYSGECCCESFLDYILFVTFFPQLVAGPIVSHHEMLPQFAAEENKKINYEKMTMGVQAFTLGLFKKVVIADNFGRFVNQGYSILQNLNSFEAILTIISYTIQIYYDFSGYCDMATGIAWMFNIDLPINFQSPYKAVTILDFWKRWHITLTRFLTKYIYIPLGGNRKGNYRTYFNIFVVFLVSGIWHGAGYTFILWGILHGIANILCRVFKEYVDKIPKWINWLITFSFVNCTWVIFRAENLDQVFLLFSRIFAGGISIGEELRYTITQVMLVDIPYQILPLTIVLSGYSALCILGSIVCDNTIAIVQKRVFNLRMLVLCVVAMLISMLSLSGVSSFLYFNF